MYIAVAGAGECGRSLDDLAYRTGLEIAKRGHVLVCGGLGGVMDAAARGAHDAGGVSVGILPDAGRSRASRWLTISIPTDMGQARNALVVLAGDALIAVGGGYGTLSEIALGLKMGRTVVGLDTWDLERRSPAAEGIVLADDPAQAVDIVERST